MTVRPTLLILAAGMGSRYGGLKQVEPVGPDGETLMDYAVFDALKAGFGRVVFVIRRDFEREFRKRVGRKYEGRVAVAYVFQDLDDLPAGFARPVERTKPWGTAHAVRAARRVVTTPFAMINADDFYGHDAFARLGAFLRGTPAAGSTLAFAMVGYPLRQTLSEHGSVARGVCSTGADGLLASITEMTRLIPVPGGVENREDPARPVRLTGTEPVSMNLWGFTPGLLDALDERFPAWLRAHNGDPKAEWYIPFVVDELVREGRATVHVLPTDSSWHGITYREDRPRVANAIKRLIATGAYPSPLWR